MYKQLINNDKNLSVIEHYSWNDFINYVSEYLNNDVSKKYSKFYLFFDNNDFNYKPVIEFFLLKEEGLTVQKCLDDFVQTILDNTRYFSDRPDCYTLAIDFLIEKGAKLPISKLVDQRYGDEASLEVEVFDYHVRGYLIAYYKVDHGIPPETEPIYWENLSTCSNLHTDRMSALKFEIENARTYYGM